jgi:hypothetical protein
MREFFLSKKAAFEKSGTLPKLGFAISRKSFLETPYNAAYWTAKQKNRHSIEGTLEKPSALEIV